MKEIDANRVLATPCYTTPNMPDTREFLETNGIGGYASSTLCGMNTRRYHGLLVAATEPPAVRAVLLSKIEETLIIGVDRFELSCNQYPGVIHPTGFQYLTQTATDPFVTFIYEAAGARLEKTIFMPDGENTTVIQYHLTGRPATLELRPLLAFRGYHNLTHQNPAFNRALTIEPGIAAIQPYPSLPALYVGHDGDVHETGDWYRNFIYDRERERGLDFEEDLYQPYLLTIELADGAATAIIASTVPRKAADAPALRTAELARREHLWTPAAPLPRNIRRAASQFLVKRGEGHSVIAGYHADWSRDTVISLPGLTLSTGRPDLARSILTTLAAAASEGMLPNRFSDTGGATEYNTVDGALAFIEAARAYAAETGDFAFIHDHLYSTLADIVAWHERGTRYGIHMDADGLLIADSPGVQLTWMDAKVDEWVITPRRGKPVEVQAFWFNALRTMEEFAQRFGDPAARHYRQLADRASAAFNWLFWNQRAGCLYDVVNGLDYDASLRPNQIFAVSLPHKMLPPHRAIKVVEAVERSLLTPYGLKTLASDSPNYRGRFGGSAAERDSAYHQGTVWPWLIGPFLCAYLGVHAGSAEASAQARAWLQPLLDFLENQGAGQLPEVFDGDAPQRPGGCIAQAWSVAEIARTLQVLNSASRTDAHSGPAASSIS